jgi:hypothetical protein
MNASVGLAIAKADMQDCAASLDALQSLPDLERQRARLIPELVPCFDHEARDGGAPAKRAQ